MVVYEDLGKAPSLADVLLANGRGCRRDGLVGLATALGRLHAATAGRTPRWHEIRDALGPGGNTDRYDAREQAVGRFLTVIEATGIEISDPCRDELQRILDTCATRLQGADRRRHPK